MMSNQNGSPHKHGRATKPAKRDTLGIERAQFEAFLAELEQDLISEPCDHTLRRSRAWARRNGLNEKRFVALLEAFGGYCDDEVLYNVDPERIF